MDTMEMMVTSSAGVGRARCGAGPCISYGTCRILPTCMQSLHMHFHPSCRHYVVSPSQEYGPKFGKGDTVGACYHLGRQEIFFT